MSENEGSFPTQEQIEQRAYEIYLERGGQDGADVDDWLSAERELTDPIQDRAENSEATPQFFQRGDSVAADETHTADTERMLQELYERSRALAARAGS